MTKTTEKHSGAIPPRKLQEAALIVPALGLFLLMPPFISIFSIKVSFLGVPLIVLYIFGVWAALILITLQLSTKLTQRNTPEWQIEDGEADTRESGP